MKQVVFAVFLMAMASLTGCLNEEDSPVDDKTDDSTSDTTEDNSDTDDELIDPVGQTGDTIPEDSSIFMDNGEWGTYECTNPLDGDGDGDDNGYSDDAEDYTCTYTYSNEDSFVNSFTDDGELKRIKYKDSDGISNPADFSGWLNKTGNQVTIESLYYPDRGMEVDYTDGSYDLDGDGTNEYPVTRYIRSLNEPFKSLCTYDIYGVWDPCEVIFYGHNNLQYNAIFYLNRALGSEIFAIDTDNDGAKDSIVHKKIYEKHTVTFDLPFEPYAFSFTTGVGTVYRIF